MKKQTNNQSKFTPLDSKYLMGFTVIEMLVTLGVFIVAVGMVTSAIVFFYRTNAYTMQQSSAIASARKGVEVAVEDIREATYSDEGIYPVYDMGSTTFYCYSDIDKDDHVERVRFYLTGTASTTLVKEVTNSGGDPLSYDGPEATTTTEIISEHVRNNDLATKIFIYYDNTGTEITDYNKVLDVSFVEIKLIVNVNPNRAPDDFELRSSTALRNYVDPQE